MSKQRIAGKFSRHAITYDQYAKVQKLAAATLAAECERLPGLLPPGPLLEIGCGTGLLSERLLAAFPEREIFFTDLAPGMVAACRHRLAGRLPAGGRYHWQLLDGENPPAGVAYALIASGLTMQWFAALAQSLERLLAALLPGGYLLFSLIGAGTFVEWRRLCAALALPCTINPFPDLAAVGEMVAGAGRTVSSWQVGVEQRYPSARDFFRALQRIGAGTSLAAPSLGAGQLRELMRAWDEGAPAGVTVNYEIIYVVVGKE